MASSETLYMGIDGGGSNCRGRLRSGDGSLLGEAISGPAQTSQGIMAAQEQVARVARETLKDAGFGAEVLETTHVGIGLAELHISADKEAFRNWEHPFASLRVSSDAHIACLGGHAGARDGGILILGTGSCGYGLVKGHSVNVGGWGFDLSDMASAAQVGVLALRYAIAALDGIYEVSTMTDHIMRCSGTVRKKWPYGRAEPHRRTLPVMVILWCGSPKRKIRWPSNSCLTVAHKQRHVACSGVARHQSNCPDGQLR